MGSRSKKLQQTVLKIHKRPGIRFQKCETEKMLKFYMDKTGKSLDNKMNRAQFKEILHHYFSITDDILMDRVFRCFDQDNDLYIGMEEWVRGLSIYLKGTRDEKVRFCFTVYDLNSDGHISREEMYQLLKTTVIKNSTDEDMEETIKELIEVTMKMMDCDNDGRVSQEDFYNAVIIDAQRLEILGQCLPADHRTQVFLNHVLEEDSEDNGENQDKSGQRPKEQTQ